MSIQIPQPPPDLSPEVSAYLRRVLEAIDGELRRNPVLKASDKVVPSVQKDGSLLYFPAAVAGSAITSPGLWFVTNEQYYKVVPTNLVPADVGAAPAVHSHVISDVTGLRIELDVIEDDVAGHEVRITSLEQRMDAVENQLP